MAEAIVAGSAATGDAAAEPAVDAVDQVEKVDAAVGAEGAEELQPGAGDGEGPAYVEAEKPKPATLEELLAAWHAAQGAMTGASSAYDAACEAKDAALSEYSAAIEHERECFEAIELARVAG